MRPDNPAALAVKFTMLGKDERREMALPAGEHPEERRGVEPLVAQAPPEPGAVDHPPVAGDTVKVSDLPSGGPMTPTQAATNPFEEQFEEELARRSEGVFVSQWQDASDPSQTPPSTLVPTGPVIFSPITTNPDSTPPAGSTPSFRDYTAVTGSGPPDTDMAAGLSYIVTDYNSFFRIYDKTGVKQGGDVAFTTFFGGGATPNCANTLNNVCDPQMVYDDQNDRFVFTCIAVTSSTSYICVAASQTGDPRGTWNKYEIQPYASTLADYPHTAIGEDAIFIGTNNFSWPAGSFLNSAIVAVNKANLYAGAALTTRSYNMAATVYNPRPVVRRGFLQGQYPPAGKPHYFAVNDALNAATIWQWPQPTFTSNPSVIAGWSLAYPGNAVNPSEAAYTNLAIDSLATKIMDAEIRWPKLWFVRTGVNASTRDIINWAEVDMTNATPATVQSGNLGATNNHLWMPDCTIDKNNSMALVFTQAGVTPTVLVQSSVTGHDSGGATPTPAGQMEAIQTSKLGEVVYTGVTQNGRYRWGDYLGCQIDPNGCDIWVNGMYSANLGTANKEATWVQKWSFADCTPGATRLANMSGLTYQCHKTVTASIIDTGGTPTNAVYHTTTGGNYPATITGGPTNYNVSGATTDQLGGADGDDVWVTFTGSDALTYSSPHSKIDCSLNVCVASVEPLSVGCDGDIYADRGETLNVVVHMKNSEGFDLPTGFQADLVVDPAHPDANITIVNGTASWDALTAGQDAKPSGAPFQIRYTGAGAGPITLWFVVQNIRATDSSWTGNAACAANSFTEKANTNETPGVALVNESFDGATFPPTGWTNVQVAGTGLWARATSQIHQTMSPHSGAAMAYFNSYTFASGTVARLATPVISLAGQTLPKVTFWMTHDTQWSNDDTIDVQISTNGGTSWTTLSTVHRRDGGTSTSGVWLQHSVDLSAYIGQTNVRVGFQANGAYGNNMSIDDVWVGNMNLVNDTQNCTTAAPNITYSDGDWYFDDSQCNNLFDSVNWVNSVDPGEAGSLIVYLGNSGNETAYNVVGTLTCPTCPVGVQICKNTATYGNIPYGTSYVYAPGDNGFQIALPTGLTAGADLPFVINLTTTNPGYTPPVVNLVATPNNPQNTRVGTSTNQGACSYLGTTHVSTDAFSTLATTAGTGGRCGPGWTTTAWTGLGTVALNSTIATPTGDTRSCSLRAAATASSITRKFDTTGMDADVRIHSYINLAGTSGATSFNIQYSSDGVTFYTLASGGGAGTNAWANFSGSIYWSIWGGTGAGFGPAAANAIFNNPNFSLRFQGVRNSGTSTSYFYIDDLEVDMYKFVNQATSCTGACMAPDAPAINLIVDNNACVQNGIMVYYTGGPGAASYNLIRDGASVVTGYTSGALYNPTDSASHTYAIRGVNTAGTTDSPTQAFVDAAGTTPTFTCTPGTCTDPTQVVLTTQQGWQNYQWYRNATPIGGATTYTYTATLSGTYTVSYKAGSCTNTSAGTVVTIGSAGVKPVADGRLSGTAMRGSKVTADGTSLSITYDTATCTVTDHSIIYGNGTALNPITPSGGQCSIGNTSPYTWNPSPAVTAGSFIWWVIVGDGGTTESSWGEKYVGGTYSQRTTSPSNQCGNTAIDTTSTCP